MSAISPILNPAQEAARIEIRQYGVRIVVNRDALREVAACLDAARAGGTLPMDAEGTTPVILDRTAPRELTPSDALLLNAVLRHRRFRVVVVMGTASGATMLAETLGVPVTPGLTVVGAEGAHRAPASTPASAPRRDPAPAHRPAAAAASASASVSAPGNGSASAFPPRPSTPTSITTSSASAGTPTPRPPAAGADARRPLPFRPPTKESPRVSGTETPMQSPSPFREPKSDVPSSVLSEPPNGEDLTSIGRMSAQAPESTTLPPIFAQPSYQQPKLKTDARLSRVHVHEGRIRSGERIVVDGDLWVEGDVASGAEVVATGNIRIMGRLSGRAHAGCAGNGRALIRMGRCEAELVAVAGVHLTGDVLPSACIGSPTTVSYVPGGRLRITPGA